MEFFKDLSLTPHCFYLSLRVCRFSCNIVILISKRMMLLFILEIHAWKRLKTTYRMMQIGRQNKMFANFDKTFHGPSYKTKTKYYKTQS